VPDRLDRYREKRDPRQTPEPFGSARAVAAPEPARRRFVVQMHRARRLHWDFRLELGGTLRSWAVPKGPSADPRERRLAVEVEDHPIEYAGFEGVIPAGNYGAGEVIVWDQGTWEPDGDPEKGLADGKLVFRLRGRKLRGEWTLVRTRGEGGGKRQWLLLKHRGDAFVDPGNRHPFSPASVLTGRTVEEVAAGTSRAAEVVEEAARLGAPVHRLSTKDERPMLATQRDEPFSRPGWLFEVKYDGYRALARREGGAVTLRYRSGDLATSLFPEVAKAVGMLPVDTILDGELVVLGPDGRPSFQGLQSRGHLAGSADAAIAALESPATLHVFDLLSVGDRDVRALPLRERKRLLRMVVPDEGPVQFADHVEADGKALFREVASRDLEGIVAKRGDSPYRSGRSESWVKIRRDRTGDFVVIGFTSPRGGRSGFGALHLAAWRDGELTYAGSVGTGFTEQQLEFLHARLSATGLPEPAFAGEVPRGRGNTWVVPEVVVEVRFKEWTRDGLLRQPAFLRVRDDKGPDDALRIDGRDPIEPAEPPAAPEPMDLPDVDPAARRVEVTNPDKVFFPQDGLTKGDLVAYYRAIAPRMLPFLKDRPLVLTRYPDGIDGKSFFQKDAPSWRPGWIRTVRVHSEEADRDLECFLVDDEDGLAWLANLGTIPIHVWSSRADSLERPDWCIVDLDPKEAPFAHVVELARGLHDLCEELGVPSYVKTTGQKGLHVLVPLGRQLTHEQSRAFAESLARTLELRHPEVSTTARPLGARRGKVYLDFLQNGLGKTIVAPYSVRPRPGAPVSVPLRWIEVNRRLDPAWFTIQNVPRRAARMRTDPLLPVLDGSPDLAGALERLREILSRSPPPGAARTAPRARRPPRA
jgi:bifunctional non-homologous end joining protein LigD